MCVCLFTACDNVFDDQQLFLLFLLQVCLGLRFLASGAIYSACGDTQGVDKGTVCRSVWPLVNFLNSIAHR